jgi:hypothetical protein
MINSLIKILIAFIVFLKMNLLTLLNYISGLKHKHVH